MKVSIITVCYNSESTIKDTIESVLSQEYVDIQYIIVDGGSTDQTVPIIRSYGNKVSKFISKPDKGMYDAMNKGLALADGDIVGILNSDDFYPDPCVVSDVVSSFILTRVDSLYGNLLYVNCKNVNKVERLWSAGEFKRSSFLWGWMPPHPTFFVKREIYLKYGGFDLKLRTAADYEMMLRLLYVKRITVTYLDRVLVHMRNGGASNSSVKSRISANRQDRYAWKINKIEPYPFTLLFKPLRKIPQFFAKKIKNI